MLFRIETVTERDDGIWQVELKLTNDEDKQLRHLTDRYREEIQGPTALHRLAILLCKMGEDRKAKEVYELLLGRTNEDDMEERAYIYNQLGIVCSAINNQEAALAHFKKSLELHLTYLSPDAPQLASCYSNIGQCLRNQGNFSETLEQYQRCLDIELSQPELDQDQRSIAMTHYNIGDLFLEHDCLDEALKSHERSLKLRLASLPPLHPDLAYSYGQIGSIFMNQGNYKEAGIQFQKALELGQKSLPPSHSYLAITYNNMAAALYRLRKYEEALQHVEKSIQIVHQIFPVDHPTRTSTEDLYNQIRSIVVT
ncbi:unnamed protein product [Didymodactylos carnosus]|uniref:Uncharacterized protein n=1 Tax=Didymodactylos carnosus TaxID=1234261 RepID=A0A814Y2T7_9BILA|nr:unnamed protein product [Didymodactylos carnosus]CAF3987549.1 unnamed protein product [Didymodactylos carnosus]